MPGPRSKPATETLDSLLARPNVLSFPRAGQIEGADPRVLLQLVNASLQELQKLVEQTDAIFVAAEREFPDFKKPKFEIFRAETSRILARLASPRLYAGVIGEFACGKSSFINAFIRQNLLPVNVVPGATKIPAILVGHPANAVLALSSDGVAKVAGSTRSFRAGQTGDIFNVADAAVSRLSASTKNTAEGKENMRRSLAGLADCEAALVLGNFPSQENQLALVDTPGLGQLDEALSGKALQIAGECDALIVLTNLEAPLSKSLFADIRKTCGHNPQLCVFVGTHLDCIPDSDLPKMESFFAFRLRQFTGWNQKFCFVSNVTGAWAGQITDNEGSPNEDWRSMLRNYLEKRSDALRGVNACRHARKLAQKLQEALLASSESLSRGDSGASGAYLRESRQNLLQKFGISAQSASNMAREMTCSEIKKCAAAIAGKIYSFEEISTLRKYIDEELQKRLMRLYRDISVRVIAEAMEPLAALAEKSAAEFARQAGLPQGGVEFADADLRDNGRYNILRFRDVAELQNMTADVDKKLWQGGGIAAGLCAAAMLPGVGWLAGGALAAAGLFMGGFGKNATKERDEYLRRLDAYFGRILEELPAKAASHVEYAGMRLEKKLSRALLEKATAGAEAKRPRRTDDALRRKRVAERLGQLAQSARLAEHCHDMTRDKFTSFL